MAWKRDVGHVPGVDPGPGGYWDHGNPNPPTEPPDYGDEPEEVETKTHCPRCDTWHAGEPTHVSDGHLEGDCEECAYLVESGHLVKCPECGLAATREHVRMFGTCFQCLWLKLFPVQRDLETIYGRLPTTDPKLTVGLRVAINGLKRAIQISEYVDQDGLKKAGIDCS